ncbi:MAG: FoF1 ATP synthase subunit a [Desulfobacterales bacterium]
MEHPYLFFVKIFEMIGLGHFAHENPHVIYAWVVIALIVGLGAMAAKGVSMIPTKAQNVSELIVSGMEEFMVDITGEEGRWLFPLAGTVFLYVFIGNLIGLVPGFFPPTANLNTTASIALVVFTFTHVIGIKYHGAKYIKHFLRPVWWIGPLIFIIEIIGHFARILSLSFRLFRKHDGSMKLFWPFFSALPAPFSHRCRLWPWVFCRVCSGVCIFSVVNYLFLRGHGACH